MYSVNKFLNFSSQDMANKKPHMDFNSEVQGNLLSIRAIRNWSNMKRVLSMMFFQLSDRFEYKIDKTISEILRFNLKFYTSLLSFLVSSWYFIHIKLVFYIWKCQQCWIKVIFSSVYYQKSSMTNQKRKLYV